MGITEIIIICAVLLVIVILLGYIRSRRSSHQAVESNNQVYIGNLAYRVTEYDLRDFFQQYGYIDRLKIVRDSRTRRSKGYGFVTFGSDKEATKALIAHGQDLSGRALVVRIAKPK